ncbi:MAG TPA: GlxA family transcriptional regulator, partial [Steroidobacteraceae bacterium]|nr:GlxA family transcriptional regulator [Steroidobacteraceae bacterium]
MARTSGEPRRLAFLLVPQFSMMAFSSALEPLRAANRIAEQRLFEWQLTSIDGAPVLASNGIPVAVHAPLDQLGKLDMIVVCVGLEPLQFARGHRVHHLLRRLACHGCRVGGISTGTFVLADAGLLTERRCTVHWEYADLFRSRHPRVQLTEELYVVDDDVFTCSGGTAALDMMLHFVSEQSGIELALAVAEQFIHPHIRKQEDRQRMDRHARYGIGSPKLVEIIRLMEGAVDEPIDVADIARRVAISTRQVERLFKHHLDISPKLFYLRLRVSRAQMLLRQTLNPIREV